MQKLVASLIIEGGITVNFGAVSVVDPDTGTGTINVFTNNTALNVTIPGNAGSEVSVTTTGGTSNPFTVGPGTFDGFDATASFGTPADGAEASANIGQVISIIGTDLRTNANVIFPTVNDSGVAGTIGVRISNVSLDGTEATVSVPNTTVTGNIFMLGAPGVFQLQIVPRLTSFTNNDFRPSGNSRNLRLNGSGFVEGAITVNYGDVPVVDPATDTNIINVFSSGTSLDSVIPSRPGSVITVVTEGGTSNELTVGPASFTGVDAVANIGTPADGGAPAANVSQAFTITGSGLRSNTNVQFQRTDDSGLLGVTSARVSSVNFSGTEAIVTVPTTAVTGTLVVPGTQGPPLPVPDLETLDEVYSNDFNASTGPEWSSQTRTTTTGDDLDPAETYLGRFSNSNVTLTLTGLPEHSIVTVEWDLFIIDSWDGGVGSFGPDRFGFHVAGQAGPEFEHTFPRDGAASDIPRDPDVTGEFGPISTWQDRLYRDLTHAFKHTGDTLEIVFFGSGLQGVNDESWGLDNIRVLVDDTPGVAEETLQIVPRITSFSNTDFKPSGNSRSLQLNGGGFIEGRVTVDFGGVSVEDPSTNTTTIDVFSSGTSLNVPIPLDASSEVTVTTDGGTSNTFAVSATSFTGLDATTNNGTPADGGLPSANTGQAITLFGSGFRTNTNVRFPAIDDSGNLTGTIRRVKSINIDGTEALVDVPNLSVTGVIEVIGVDTALPVPDLGTLTEALSEDFEASVGPEWSRTNKTTAPDESTLYLGRFGNENITMKLDSLPAHSAVVVEIDLYILDTWDAGAGSDFWGFQVEGRSGPEFERSFPRDGTATSFPGDPDATGDFGGVTGTVDKLYRGLTHAFEHNGDTLEMVFFGRGLQALSDESWGIDNVRILLDTSAGAPLNVLQIVPKISSFTNTDFKPSGTSRSLQLNGGGFIEGRVTVDLGDVSVVDPGTNTTTIDVFSSGTGMNTIIPNDAGSEVTVTTNGGTSNTVQVSATSFTGFDATASFGTPADGGLPSANVGQAITLFGSGFRTNTNVRFSAINDSGVLTTTIRRVKTVNLDGTEALVDVPNSAVTGDFSVIGADESFPLQIVPRITSFTNTDFRPSGTSRSIQLNGGGFVEGSITVHFGDSDVADPDVSTGTIDVFSSGTGMNSVIPSSPGALVSVTTAGGTSNEIAVSATSFTGISSVSTTGTPADPTEASVDAFGQAVLDGVGFRSNTNVVFPTINDAGVEGTARVRVSSVSLDATSAVVSLPTNVNTGDISVIGIDGSFLLQVVPRITSFTNTDFRPGVNLRLNGRAFNEGNITVHFNGTPVVDPDTGSGTVDVFGSSTAINVTIPSNPGGEISVETAGGTSDPFAVGPTAFTGIEATADLGTPADGGVEASANPGQRVLITGAHFGVNTRVIFQTVNDSGIGGTNTVSLTNISPDGTSAFVTVPTAIATTTAVSIPGASDTQTLQNVPRLDSFSFTPDFSEGSILTLTGVGFVEGEVTIHFGPVSVIDPDVDADGTVVDVSNSNRQIVVTIPASAGESVTVETGGGTSNTMTMLLPNIRIDSPKGGETVNAEEIVEVTATAFDPDGIESIEFFLDGVLQPAFDGELFVTTTDGRANIFGAGKGSAPGGGLLPPGFSFEVSPGYVMRVLNVTGSVSGFASGCRFNGADGGQVCGSSTNVASSGGISGIIHGNRTMFLAGVFIDDTEPTDPAPDRLDVTNANDAAVISPLLNQTFFIGDGLASDGTPQEFSVPDDATRLFLGFIETFNFSTGGAPGAYTDNGGSLSVGLVIADSIPATLSVPEVVGATSESVTAKFFFTAPALNGDNSVTIGARASDANSTSTAEVITVEVVEAAFSIDSVASFGTPADPGLPSANAGQTRTLTASQRVFTGSTLAIFPTLNISGVAGIAWVQVTGVSADGKFATIVVPTSATTGVVEIQGVGSQTLQVVPRLTTFNGNNDFRTGQFIRLFGSGFMEGSISVDFGDASVVDPDTGTGTIDVHDSNRQLNLNSGIPADADGTVTVTTTGGTSNPMDVGPTSLTDFAAVASIGTPADGGVPSANALQTITVTGTGFRSSTNVTFPTIDTNGITGAVTVRVSTVLLGGTEATVVVPQAAVTGDVTMPGTDESFRLQIVPRLFDSFTNTDFRSGVNMRLNGRGFIEGGITVNFGDVSIVDPDVGTGTINVFSTNSALNVSIPGGGGGEISVETEGGVSNTVVFGPTSFTGFAAVATIGTPADGGAPSANASQTITVTGTDFRSNTNLVFSSMNDSGIPVNVAARVSSVNLDGTEATVVVTQAAVTGDVTMPGTDGSIPLQIVPRISSFSFTSFTPGVNLRLNGRGFVEGAITVNFGSVALDDPDIGSGTINVFSANSAMNMTIPEGAQPDEVFVETEGGTSNVVALIEDTAGIPPTVAITAPIPGETVLEGGAILITASATDDVFLTEVRFSVKDPFFVEIATFTDKNPPFEFLYFVPAGSPLQLVIDATATDLADNVGESDDVIVFVEIPTVSIDSVASIGVAADAGVPSANVSQTITFTGDPGEFDGGTIVTFPTTNDSGVRGTVNVAVNGAAPDGSTATVAVPLAASTGGVTVSNIDGNFGLRIVPSINSFTNNDFRPSGTSRTLTLSGSGYIEGGITVSFDGVDVVDPSNSSSIINVFSSGNSLNSVIPAGPGPSVSVITAGGTSNSIQVGPTDFTGIETSADFGTPADGGQPSANVGQAITVTGAGFGSNTNVTFPTLGDTGIVGTTSVRVASFGDGTEAVVTVPNTAVTGNVSMPGNDGSIFLQVVPRITSFTNSDFRPSGASRNLTLIGNGFVEGGITVHFGDTDVIDPNVSSTTVDVFSVGTGLSSVIPSNPGALVSVTTAGGTSNEVEVGPTSFTELIASADFGIPADGGERSANVGQVITLEGTNFRTNANVTFPTVNDSGISSFSTVRVSGVNIDGTEAVATVPNTAVTGNVTMPGNDGSIFMQVVPRITSFTNSDFRPSGASRNLTLIGNGFVEGGITVHFGDTDVIDPDVSTGTIDVFSVGTGITSVIPSNPGALVSVTTAGGTSNEVEVGPTSFTELIASADFGTPADGGERSANVGQSITLEGTNFRSNSNVAFPTVGDTGISGFSTVRVSGVNIDGTEAVVTVPNTAVTGSVTMPGNDGSIFLQVVPRITSFTNSDFRPSGASRNLTLIGNGFVEGGITAHFGDTDVIDPDVSTGIIDVFSVGTGMNSVIPSNPGALVSVTTAGGTSNEVEVSATSFTELIASADFGTPTDGGERSANVGQSITLEGTNFRSNSNVTFPTVNDSGITGFSTVRVSGVNIDGTEAVVTVPNTAVTGSVTMPGNDDSFFLQVVPRITSFSFTSFSPGSNLRLNGRGFVEGDITIHFGGTDVVDPNIGSTTVDVFSSGTAMNVTIPAGAEETVSVTTLGGTSNAVEMFLPTVTITSPRDGDAFAEESTIIIKVSALDSGGIASVDFLIDGSVAFTDDTSPYQFEFTMPVFDEGGDNDITLGATVTDTDANTADADDITISVVVPSFSFDSTATEGTPVDAGESSANVGQTITFTANYRAFDSSTSISFPTVNDSGVPSETFVNNSRVSLDGTTVNAVVPNTAATGDVKLFGLPDTFFLQIVPRVTTFSNNSDFRPGVNLRLHGNGFIEGGITVHFGDVDVVDPSTSSTTINVHSSGTLMDVTMPSGAGSGVSVTTGGGTSNVFFVGPESFTDLIADANEGTPADSGERSANVGQTITILGSGFRSNTNVSFPSVSDSGAVGTINVRIGGLNVTRTQATVVVPNTAATGEVKLFGLPDSFFLQIVPRITTFSSNSDFRPGVNLRLHGNGFIEGGITVHFGSVDVVDPSTSSTTINVHSSGTLMDVTMPTGADGGMSVTTEGGTSNVFFVGPESFTDLIADANEGTPADSGERSANVGQTITILGSGFRSNTNVSFPSVSDSGVPGTINVRIGGLNADRTEATVVVPNTAATGDVKLVGLPDSFFLQIVPRITTFSSNSDFRPGVNLRLHGGGFIEGGITVHFGSVDVVDPSTSSTTINVHSSGTLMDVTMPTGADGGMSVTTEGGTSNVFFVGPESFTDLIADANEGTPADSGERSANVGQTITILGSGFRSNTNVSFPSVNDSGAVGTINVRIGGLNADRTEATVVVPNTAATGDVKLVGLPDSFFLQIVPRITTFSSNNDFRPGVNLRLHGGGFIEGDITVHFGSVDVVDPSTSSTTINVHSSGTLMDVTMPTGADGGMSVTTEGGTSNVFFVGPESFTDLIAVANIGTPADSGERSANVGQAITLVGSGFRTNTNVSFPSVNDSGTPGFSFVRVAFINSDRTEATVTVPLNAATGEVTVPGTDTSFLLQIVPRITSSSVTGGVLTPGQNLRLNGSGFIEGGSTVRFGDVDVVDPDTGSVTINVFSTNTAMNVTIPNDAGPEVTVTTAGGTSNLFVVE